MPKWHLSELFGRRASEDREEMILVGISTVVAGVGAGVVASALPADAERPVRLQGCRVPLRKQNFNSGSGDHWRNFAANNATFTDDNWKEGPASTDSGDGMNDETSSIWNRKTCGGTPEPVTDFTTGDYQPQKRQQIEP